MAASYCYDEIPPLNAVRKASSDRLGASPFKSEANRGIVRLLIVGNELFFLFFGEYLVEPIFTKTDDNPPDL